MYSMKYYHIPLNQHPVKCDICGCRMSSNESNERGTYYIMCSSENHHGTFSIPSNAADKYNWFEGYESAMTDYIKDLIDKDED